MRKIGKRSILIERAHKVFVVTCIGLTLYGLSGLAQRWYRYFTVLRPEAQQRELAKQENLLREGSSDLLQDSVQNLRT